jgi:nitric oxide reductase NorQ protein
MPICEKCLRTIPDKAMDIHRIVCKGTANKPPAPAAVTQVIQPVVNVTPTPEPVVVADTKSAPEAVATVPVVISTPAVQGTAEGDMEIMWPQPDKNFIISQVALNLFRATVKLSQQPGKKANILLCGHPGCGKTSGAIQLAAVEKRPIVIADFGAVQEPQNLFQTVHIVQGKGDSMLTEVRESNFIKGIETPNCVVVMDEMTRVENERCLNPLMPLLDGRGYTWIDELHRRVYKAPGVIFIATINEGSLFAGVSSLDAALRERFGEAFMDYLPAEQEKLVIMAKTGVPEPIARTLTQFAFTVRTTDSIQKKISTRQLLTAGDNYASGLSLWEAVFMAIGNYGDNAWRQEILEVFSMNIKDEVEYQKWRLHDQVVEQFVNYC